MSTDESQLSRRRDFLKKASLGLASGAFGLSVFSRCLMKEAYGITPDPTLQKYDATITLWFEGGPGQTDTFDPKPGSTSQVFPTINLGSNDIYGNPIYLTNLFPNLSNLFMNDPAIKLGIVRSLHHENMLHTLSQTWMNCFWQSPVANLYPSTSAVMAYLLKDSAPLGIPSVQIVGTATGNPCCAGQGGPNGDDSNTAKGGNCPTAFTVFNSEDAVAMLSKPAGVTPQRYETRRQIIAGLNAGFNARKPDTVLPAWDEAWKQACDITTAGKAAAAFDLTNATLLTGEQSIAADSQLFGIGPSVLRQLTLAQRLIIAGVPYVSCGITGNDTHSGNTGPVTSIWGGLVDPAVAQMCKNLKATGKRVLILLGGEFGRGPQDVVGGRDGRDHWGSGFSWAMISINQPAFKQTAVGYTGPDGVWTPSTPNNPLAATGDISKPLVDPIAPGALGGLLYRSMGFAVGSDPRTNVPTVSGMASPVDPALAAGIARLSAPWLMQQFGLA
jgi:hypothetical protein